MSSYCVSIPTTTVDRPPRKPSPPELERGLVRVRVRHSKSKMLDRFRAVGVIEFEPDFVEQVLSTTSGDTYAHSPPPFDFNITILYYIIHPSIHHIVFALHLSSPFPLDNHIPLATHISTCILSVFISHKSRMQ